MSAVRELLDRLTEIGATIRPAGDHLLLRAGAKPVPAELVKRIRQTRSEMLAVLSKAAPSLQPIEMINAADAVEAHRWRQRFTTRVLEWFKEDRDWDSAMRLAWGDLENEWHYLHGRRSPAWQCAGCQRPIGSFDAIELPDGNFVHFEPIDCLINFGRRWRGDAQAALLAFGLKLPDAKATRL